MCSLNINNYNVEFPHPILDYFYINLKTKNCLLYNTYIEGERERINLRRITIYSHVSLSRFSRYMYQDRQSGWYYFIGRK